LQVNLINVGNERYFENGNTNNNFYPGQPRTLRASAMVRF
jgi:outer membrane receptor for Fe3+-dicitrate